MLSKSKEAFHDSLYKACVKQHEIALLTFFVFIVHCFIRIIALYCICMRFRFAYPLGVLFPAFLVLIACLHAGKEDSADYCRALQEIKIGIAGASAVDKQAGINEPPRKKPRLDPGQAVVEDDNESPGQVEDAVLSVSSSKLYTEFLHKMPPLTAAQLSNVKHVTLVDQALPSNFPETLHDLLSNNVTHLAIHNCEFQVNGQNAPLYPQGRVLYPARELRLCGVDGDYIAETVKRVCWCAPHLEVLKVSCALDSECCLKFLAGLVYAQHLNVLDMTDNAANLEPEILTTLASNIRKAWPALTELRADFLCIKNLTTLVKEGWTMEKGVARIERVTTAERCFFDAIVKKGVRVYIEGDPADNLQDILGPHYGVRRIEGKEGFRFIVSPKPGYQPLPQKDDHSVTIGQPDTQNICAGTRALKGVLIHDILPHVTCHLSEKDLYNLASTCKTFWNDLVRNNNAFMQRRTFDFYQFRRGVPASYLSWPAAREIVLENVGSSREDYDILDILSQQPWASRVRYVSFENLGCHDLGPGAPDCFQQKCLLRWRNANTFEGKKAKFSLYNFDTSFRNFLSAEEQTTLLAGLQRVTMWALEESDCNTLRACPALEELFFAEDAGIDWPALIKLLREGPHLKQLTSEGCRWSNPPRELELDLYQALATQERLEVLYWCQEITERAAFDAAVARLRNLKEAYPKGY